MATPARLFAAERLAAPEQTLLIEAAQHPAPPPTVPLVKGMTARQQHHAQRGRHPLGHLMPEGEDHPAQGHTCGDCGHLQRNTWTKTYLKCALLRATKGPGTDTRARWPACGCWRPQEETP